MEHSFNSLKNAFIDLEKSYLNTLDKESIYPELGTLKHDIFRYLESVKWGYYPDIPASQKDELKQYRKKLNFFISDFESNYYRDWIKNGKFEIKLKNCVEHSDLKTYYRRYNFDLISHSDPFTDDEKMYVMEFIEDCYPEQYKTFTDVPLKLVQQALMCLLTN